MTKGLDKNAKMKPSGVDWLGDVPEHWVCSSLKYFAKIIDCKHITAEFINEGFPLASISEVKGWNVDLSSAKKTTAEYYNELISGGRDPLTGDIIYSRNATVGEAAIVEEFTPDFAMGQDVCLIRGESNLLPEFMMYIINSKVISQQLELLMVGSTFKRINVHDIKNFILAIPPIDVQHKILSYFETTMVKIDKMIEKASYVIEKLQEYRSAIITSAVTGKIDIRNIDILNKKIN